MNYYGTDLDYIHLKFGDMRKAYNFTDSFRAKHPNFCKEYEKYWDNEPCRFDTPLQIAQYVDMYSIPVHFYFNYTDTPARNIEEVYAYLLREYTGNTKYDEEGKFREDWNDGLDGEKEVDKEYKVLGTTESRVTIELQRGSLDKVNQSDIDPEAPGWTIISVAQAWSEEEARARLLYQLLEILNNEHAVSANDLLRLVYYLEDNVSRVEVF